jgi:hypothetical protein
MSKKLNNDPNLLQRAAQRASHRVSFVASALSAYQAQEKIEEKQLAAYLDCLPDKLPKLSLCRRPDPSSSNFQKEVRQIAEYADVNMFRLAQLLRRVDSITALQSVPLSQDISRTTAFLIAARDRDSRGASAEQCSSISSDSEENNL